MEKEDGDDKSVATAAAAVTTTTTTRPPSATNTHPASSAGTSAGTSDASPSSSLSPSSASGSSVSSPLPSTPNHALADAQSGTGAHFHRPRRSRPEIWRCFLGCGQSYRKSSGRSIRRHTLQCFRQRHPEECRDMTDDQLNAMLASRQETGLIDTGLRTWRLRQQRRAAQQLPPSERWQCPKGCGRFYRATSIKSIHKHEQLCTGPHTATPLAAGPMQQPVTATIATVAQSVAVPSQSPSILTSPTLPAIPSQLDWERQQQQHQQMAALQSLTSFNLLAQHSQTSPLNPSLMFSMSGAQSMPSLLSMMAMQDNQRRLNQQIMQGQQQLLAQQQQTPLSMPLTMTATGSQPQLSPNPQSHTNPLLLSHLPLNQSLVPNQSPLLQFQQFPHLR